MTKERTEITNVETLHHAISELENHSAQQLVNIKFKTNHLKENFFLKTDIERYSFDKGQKVEPELLKLLVTKILRPKSIVGGTFGTLVSTFVVQKYGKKLTKQLKKLMKHLLP
tara:strand:- start:1260 stop:1598 length:339 start_codon:yes stop_codon:yes gene_type:complete